MIRKDKIKVYDMTCTSCEGRVEKEIRKLPGIISAMASFSSEEVLVEYDTEFCNVEMIKSAVKSAGYSTKSTGKDKIIGILIIVGAVLLLGNYTGGFDMSEKLGQDATYFVLFVVGLLTSIHCVGMCGGIMLTQTINSDSSSKLASVKPALMYNVGRLISYTILGGIFGAIGSAISISLGFKAGVMIVAGVFMIIMGLNMFGFSWFRKFNIKLPWSSCSVKNKSKSPFIIGLLNGFLPCGPLQTMQLYALGTGSVIKGATSMFIFALGTIPLMMVFGAVAGFLSKGYSKKILKFSGILIVVLGLIMSNRGLALVGININPMDRISAKSVDSSSESVAKAEIIDGVQVVKTAATYYGYEPRAIFIQKGIPVKWIITGEQITSCNNAIIIPSMNIQKNIKKGENIIEFTPKDDKDINYSCWMGMIRGVIKVVDDLGSVDTANADVDLPPSSGGSCCAGGAPPVQRDSIYGSDISKVPTDKLVKKVDVSGSSQSAKVKGIGYEFDPLIVVVNKNVQTDLIIDLSSFDNPEQEFVLIDGATNKDITSFKGKKGTNTLSYNFKEPGVYGIVNGEGLLMLIEVVDDVKSSDLEKIRSKYIR